MCTYMCDRVAECQMGGKMGMVSKKTSKQKTKLGDSECTKKALRSCGRCRKNKIRCDSIETRPHACTNCARKGVECQIDYVTPPQRSKEMKYLCENVRFVESKIEGLVEIYEGLLCRKGVETRYRANLSCPTRVLHLKGEFFSFCLDEEKDQFCVNNLKISGGELRKSLGNFQKILRTLLEIYFQWEDGDESTLEKAEKYVSEITIEKLLERNELLLLLCILNFYFDIPNLRYLDLFSFVIESYCYNASNEGNRRMEGLGKDELARLIVGNKLNGVQFHSEIFIKNFTTYLFVHIVLYGPVFFMDCFMDKYIGTLETLRKKINFDKNWEVKWVNFYIRLLNLIEANCSLDKKKFLVEDEEIEETILQIDREKEQLGSLDCFIALVKIDQFFVERKGIPDSKIMQSLLFVLKKLSKEFDLILGNNDPDSEGERLCFVHVFLHQLFSLNKILCANHCGSTLEPLTSFCGFNHEFLNYYYTQKITGRLEDVLHEGPKSKLPNCMLEALGLNIVKHRSGINRNKGLVKIVEEDFRFYRNGDNQSLKILKSSCHLIWNLYEKVVYWGMFDKLYVHEPFVWDVRLLLENNSFVCQGDDSRWERNDGFCKTVEKPDEAVYDVKPRVCRTDEDGDRKEKVIVVVEEELKLVSALECHKSYKSKTLENRELGDCLRGGINQILQDVDWVKESADDVLRKIHGVLN